MKARIIALLRRTEHYTKTDMVYLARGGFWSLLSQVVGSGSSFIVVVLLANILPKEMFGQYRFILSVLPILALFTLPGIGTTLMRSVARGQEVDFDNVVKTKIRWGYLGSLASLCISGYYFYMGNGSLGYTFFVTSVFIPFVETYYIYLAYYKGKQDFKTAALYDSLSRVFQAGVLIVTALFTQNILALVTVFLVGQFVTRFFFYRKMRREINRTSSLETKENSTSDDTISYGKSLSLTTITGTVKASLDKVLLWHFLGAETVAVYAVAQAIPNNVSLFFNVVPRVAFPKFAQNTWEKTERQKVIRKILIFFIALVVPAILYAILVPFVIPILFKNYLASVAPALIMGFLIVFLPVNALIEQVLSAQKFVKKLFTLQIVELIVFAVCFLLLYKPYGVSGVAVALVASRAASLLLGILFVR